MTQRHIVPEGAAGERLDVFLAHTTGLTRSRVSHLIRDGAVLVNGHAEKPSYQVQASDTMELAQAPLAQPTLEAPNLPVVYEDEAMLVVNKPPGLAVHPGAAAPGQLPAATVADFARSRSTDPDPSRPGIVHRLDRDTSGLLVLAKTPEAKTMLQQQFHDRKVKKTYLALVVGRPRPDAADINLAVGRHPVQPLRQAVTAAGRTAITRYRTLGSYRGYSLMEAQPATGRTHQIRVHFAAIGHPVAGDTTYGLKTRPLGLKRQFLHAAGLIIISPTGQRVELQSPLPDDLTAALAKLGDQV